VSLLRDVLNAPIPGDLHVNYRYMLSWARAVTDLRPGARVLDFGCGDGRVVRAAGPLGLDVVGADVFYGGSEARRDVETAGLLGTSVREIRDGRIDFESGAFDLVVSNQVFEHVEALEPTLAEVARVLKPDGLLVCLFPTREVLREAHCGVPLLHWLERDDRRIAWAARWQRMGFGFDKQKKSPEAWAREAVEWMDRYVRYRPRRDVLARFSRRFQVDPIEEHYLAYRLRAKGAAGGLAPLLGIPWAAAAGRAICRRFNGVVWRARRVV
jgi:SAM-dependent methyltransferase